jgi:hypothetical protein
MGIRRVLTEREAVHALDDPGCGGATGDAAQRPAGSGGAGIPPLPPRIHEIRPPLITG